MSKYKEILDNMIWSFSRLHLYETCPYAFYMRYIEGLNGVQNFFAENGSVMHEIFEKILKGELKLESSPGYYIDEFDCISTYTKQTTMDNTFDKCLNYLCSLENEQMEKYKIVGVEKKCSFELGEKSFTGYIDLLLEDTESGDFLLIDHKSADHFLKKDGSVLKNQESNFYAYRHQMYLYSKYVYEEYGKFPQKIIWHHFKDNGKLTIIDFNKADYEETLEWAEKMVQRVYKDNSFNPQKDYMQCFQICNFRDGDCEYKNED